MDERMDEKWLNWGISKQFWLSLQWTVEINIMGKIKK
jgi:plasmid maintenance system antidote protein VapI